MFLRNLAHSPDVYRAFGLRLSKLQRPQYDLLSVLARADLADVPHVLSHDLRLVDGAVDAVRSVKRAGKSSGVAFLLLKIMDELVARAG